MQSVQLIHNINLQHLTNQNSAQFKMIYFTHIYNELSEVVDLLSKQELSLEPIFFPLEEAIDKVSLESRIPL